MPRTIFITGTDTGVGKTVVTALLSAFAGHAVALKPFSSGDRTDAELLAALTNRSAGEINPWHFKEPVSPWTAARRAGMEVTLEDTLTFIRSFKTDLLFVEGAGGVLTPLGEQFAATDLVRELHCEVILVAANRLGVLNQARMALTALQNAGVRIALVEHGARDPSVETNLDDLRELVAPVPVVRVPFLPNFQAGADFIRHATNTHKAVLEDILRR